MQHKWPKDAPHRHHSRRFARIQSVVVNGILAAALLMTAGCISSRSSNIAGKQVDPTHYDRFEQVASDLPIYRTESVIKDRSPANHSGAVRLASAESGHQESSATAPSISEGIESSEPLSDEPISDIAFVTLASSEKTSVDEIPPGYNDVTLATEEQAGRFNTAPSASAYQLSLGNILYLADVQNPNIALARERINEAYARVEQADTLWLPSIRSGLNYNHHDGAIQDVAGRVFNTSRSSFYGGMGAGAVGAGSPIAPGLLAQFHLTDAIFQPRIASHQASSRQYGAAATRNDALRDAAFAYLELVRAEQDRAIAQQALFHTEELSSVTSAYARTGQGLQSDNERVLAEVAVRRDEVVQSEEAVVTASARLAALLHADPWMTISSGEPVVIPLEILKVQGTAGEYVATGLSRRPELAEQQQMVCEAIERMKRERYAPLIPSVLLGVSYGGFGGGFGSDITNSNGRLDADAMAYWEVRNLGFGEKAAREQTSSAVRQAQWRNVSLMDTVAREVVDAHTQVIKRRERIEICRLGVVAAKRSFDLNLDRIRNAQGLPIEVLQSIQALRVAQRTFLNAVVDYNQSQFQLCHATGWFLPA